MERSEIAVDRSIRTFQPSAPPTELRGKQGSGGGKKGGNLRHGTPAPGGPRIFYGDVAHGPTADPDGCTTVWNSPGNGAEEIVIVVPAGEAFTATIAAIAAELSPSTQGEPSEVLACRFMHALARLASPEMAP